MKFLKAAFRGFTAMRAVFACIALFCIFTPFGFLAGPLLLGATPTSADMTTLLELFKRVYDPEIAKQENNSATTWKEFDEGKEPINTGGTGWYGETIMGGNQEGIGARAERGTLPSAGHTRPVQFNITTAYTYGCFELTGQAIEAAKQDAFAFARSKTLEITELTALMLKDYNRQILGDGTGTLATVTADGPAANTFYIDNPKYVRLNMQIDVWNGTTKSIDSRTITAITLDATGWYVTYDGADVTASSGWVVIREDNAVTGGTRTCYEMDGLQKMWDDGTIAATYLGISRTSYPIWKGNWIDNSGVTRPISADLLLQAEDAVLRACGEPPNWIRTGTGQRRKYFELVAPDKRYMTGTMDAGYERLDFNGKKLTIDVDMPVGMWFLGRREAIKKYVMRPFGIMNLDGQSLRMVTGQDLWRGYLGAYMQVATKHPNYGCVVADCTEPASESYLIS